MAKVGPDLVRFVSSQTVPARRRTLASRAPVPAPGIASWDRRAHSRRRQANVHLAGLRDWHGDHGEQPLRRPPWDRDWDWDWDWDWDCRAGWAETPAGPPSTAAAPPARPRSRPPRRPVRSRRPRQYRRYRRSPHRRRDSFRSPWATEVWADRPLPEEAVREPPAAAARRRCTCRRRRVADALPAAARPLRCVPVTTSSSLDVTRQEQLL